MFYLGLLAVGVSIVVGFAGWGEWRQDLCRFSWWAQYFCAEVPIEAQPDSVSDSPGDIKPRDHNAYGEYITEVVSIAPRQPALRFELADLPELEGVSANPFWLLLLPLLGAGLGVSSVALTRRALEQALSRAPTTRQLLDLIDLARLQPLFVSSQHRSDIAGLQYRRAGSRQLDVGRSATASAKRGMPTLVHSNRQRRRHFLIALPVSQQHDWQGAYLLTLAEELGKAGLLVTVCQYQRSPTYLKRSRSSEPAAPLSRWRQRHSNSTLVVFVEQKTLFHSVFGNPLGWLADLHTWQDHLLLSNGSVAAAQQQQLQQAGYRVLEAGLADMLQPLLQHLQPSSASAPLVESVRPPASLPPALELFGTPASMHNQPSPEQLAQVMGWLRYHLSADAFRLLCASVIYPRPDWRLTRALAHRLADEPGWHPQSALQSGSPRLLAPLVQLPWSQHGAFPLWLRRALVQQLNGEQERQVAGLLRGFLRSGMQGQTVQPMALSVDTPVGGISHWLAWLRRDNPLQDALFSSVIHRHRLSLTLPKWASRQLRQWYFARGAATQMLWRAAAGAALAGALGWVVWQQISVPAQLEQRIAERCRLNADSEVRIQFSEPLRPQALVLASSLTQLCYRPSLRLVAPNETGADTNQLRAPQADVQLLSRAIRYALYELPVEAKTAEQSFAVFTLSQALRSGQVFTDHRTIAPLPSVPDEMLPVVELEESDHANVAETPTTGNGAEPLAPAATVIEPEMINIPAGVFMMGSPESADEQPVHEVSVPAFSLGETEVTWREWQACEAAGVCEVLPRPDWIANDENASDHPVVSVSWNQAQVYIDWLNRNTAGGYRLPTEAEWEYAARAGTTTRYSFGDNETDLCEFANGAGNETDFDWRNQACADDYPRTAPAGRFKNNPFSLYDMHGNVWEWVQDCYVGNYNDAPADGSAFEGSVCDRRMLRGGGWSSRPVFLRSANRDGDSLDDGFSVVGFRLARTP